MLDVKDIKKILLNTKELTPHIDEKENTILFTHTKEMEVWFGGYTRYIWGEVGRTYHYGFYTGKDGVFPSIVITNDKAMFGADLHMRSAPYVIEKCHNFDVSFYNNGYTYTENPPLPEPKTNKEKMEIPSYWHSKGNKKDKLLFNEELRKRGFGWL